MKIKQSLFIIKSDGVSIWYPASDNIIEATNGEIRNMVCSDEGKQLVVDGNLVCLQYCIFSEETIPNNIEELTDEEVQMRFPEQEPEIGE